MRSTAACVSIFLACALLVACKNKNLSEPVRIDGSSTVYPLLEAAAEEFQRKHTARVTIGVSGTGGGFKKFCRGEIALAGASRPIDASEQKECEKNGVAFVELPIAYDGIVLVVHRENQWLKNLTLEQLKTIWSPEAQGKVMRWNQVEPSWPDKEFRLFAPGVDSGTYDYFTEVVVGKKHASRGDIISSEDDNVLVQGVSTDPLALGFFGFAYYQENHSKLHAVPINGVTPTSESIRNGTYSPLSRPIFVYVSIKEAARNAQVQSYVEHLLQKSEQLAAEVGYVPFPAPVYSLVLQRFKQKKEGSLFAGNAAAARNNIEGVLK